MEASKLDRDNMKGLGIEPTTMENHLTRKKENEITSCPG